MLAESAQDAEASLARRGAENFASDFEEDGSPKTVPIKIGHQFHDIPEVVLKHHFPHHHRRLTWDMKVRFVMDREELKIELGRGHADMRVEYEPDEREPEGVALHKHEILDHHTHHKGEKK